MAILRPRQKIIGRRDFGVPQAGSGSIVDLFTLTGPGILKGGGFFLSNLLQTSDVDLVITVDGFIIFDFGMNLASSITDEGISAGMTLVDTTTSLDFKLGENVNWAFLTELKFEIRKTPAGADPFDVTGLMSYHVGA